MTTTTAAGGTTTAPSRTPLLAVLGLASSALLTAVGTWSDLTSNDSGTDKDKLGEWLITFGIAAVAALIAFGLVVRTAGDHASRRAVITAVVAFLSLAVFWAGIPMVLAAAAVACALVQRDRVGSFDAASKAALGACGVTTVAAVVLAITG